MYLDNAATTQLTPEVKQYIIEIEKARNPTSFS